MFVVDTNVLLYAVDSGSRHHHAANTWLSTSLGGPETVGIPWVALLGFVRIGTNPRIMQRPLSIDQADELVSGWLSQTSAVPLSPERNHARTLFELLRVAGTAGNLTTDAHVAALALERRAPVVTFDRDLARFGVRVVVPPDP
jgi:toxin-antitoxin system PIN domain toxin